MEFPKNRKLNVFSKTAVAAIVAGIMLFPYNAYAASWLDTNNYDISWYVNETDSEYVINTAKQMAGLAHLVNNENKTFMGQNIRLDEDIDLTANTWETIKDIFEGTICGSHRIILNYLDGKFVESQDISMVEYSYKILEDKNNLKNVVIGMPYTVEKLKLATGADRVFLNNEVLSDDQILLGLKDLSFSAANAEYRFFCKISFSLLDKLSFTLSDTTKTLEYYQLRINSSENSDSISFKNLLSIILLNPPY